MTVGAVTAIVPSLIICSMETRYSATSSGQSTFYLYLRRHSPIESTMSRTEALQARRYFARSLETLTQCFLHRAWPKIRGPESGSRSALVVVAHVFSWPPARLRHVRGGVGRRKSLISSPSGRLATRPTQRSLLYTSSASLFVRQGRRRSSTDGTQSLRLTRRMRLQPFDWILSCKPTVPTDLDKASEQSFLKNRA